ncbi:MAG: hypothetical protein IKQ10_05175 [Oscillospiraceae bacterium]|nr:hypothetical protein [Oscillospiraceae bacterium]
MTLYEQRWNRTMRAVRMEKVDKIPFSYSGSAYIARREGLKIADYISDYPAAIDASVRFCRELPGVDTIHTPIMNPEALKTLWLSEVKSPGKELPDDELWQIHEYKRMEREDYEKIIKLGYGPWLAEYMQKLGDPGPSLAGFVRAMPVAIGRLASEAQVPVINGGGNVGGPIEGFCGARTLMEFFMDLMEEPELVKAAMDRAFEVLYANYVATLDALPAAARAMTGAWIGGWRAAPYMLSHTTFMEFCWPYLEQLIMATIERGVLPILHFDSNWDNELETIATLPPRTCILMLDGATDPRRARRILGDRMCLMGDVPSRMLAYSTPNEVYEYTTRLIDDVGHDTGLIVSSGCDCPLNARDENVDAMIQATIDYRV